MGIGFVERFLGDDQNIAMPSEFNSGAKSCNSRAHHQKINPASFDIIPSGYHAKSGSALADPKSIHQVGIHSCRFHAECGNLRPIGRPFGQFLRVRHESYFQTTFS